MPTDRRYYGRGPGEEVLRHQHLLNVLWMHYVRRGHCPMWAAYERAIELAKTATTPDHQKVWFNPW